MRVDRRAVATVRVTRLSDPAHVRADERMSAAVLPDIRLSAEA